MVALNANALTTLIRVHDDLGTKSTPEADRRITRAINAASDAAERHCSRVFRREDGIVEDVRGTQWHQIALKRRDILSITQITQNGAVIDPTNYRILSAGAGLVFNENGWLRETGKSHWITYDPIPGTERFNLEVTYNGGFVTQLQSDTKGGPFVGLPVTLPQDLEDAIVQWAVNREQLRGLAQGIKSASTLGESVTYGEGAFGMPEPTRIVLDRYQTIGVGC